MGTRGAREGSKDSSEALVAALAMLAVREVARAQCEQGVAAWGAVAWDVAV